MSTTAEADRTTGTTGRREAVADGGEALARLGGADLLRLLLDGGRAQALARKDDWKFPASYLRIGTLAADLVATLAAEVAAFDEALWREEQLTTYLSQHLDTVILAHHDARHRLWDALALGERLAPLCALLEEYYGGGKPVLVCLDRLRAATTIPEHRDGPQLRPPYPVALPAFYRRTHVALVTSPAVAFVVGGERRHLAAGEVWEINNWRLHRVENGGTTDRVHLLVDWDAPATSRRDGR